MVIIAVLKVKKTVLDQPGLSKDYRNIATRNTSDPNSKWTTLAL